MILGARWRWFAAWALCGGTLAFCLLAALSVGVFVLPFAVVLTVWVARRSRARADALGLAAGVGAMLVAIWALNRDYTPCPAGGLTLPPGSPPGTSVSCGGFDPTPWLVAGLVLAGLAVAAYVALRRRHDLSA